MTAFHGIQVYEILDKGNLLNAIYTNSHQFNNKQFYDIDNEIAIKKTYDDKGVEGHYDCRFIEMKSSLVTQCNLEIFKLREVYEFTWRDRQNKPIWKGLGLMVGNTHISVSYVKPDELLF